MHPRTKAYLFLSVAILFEVGGTGMLPLTDGFRSPLYVAPVCVMYAISFGMLTLALRDITISTAYATWAGLGVLFVAILGHIVYKDHLHWRNVLGMLAIVVGVVLTNVR